MRADPRGERQRALSRRLEEAGLDALLVSHPPNVRYLTGFSGSTSMLLALRDEMVLVVDPRYAVQAPAETTGAARVEIAPRSLWEGLGLTVSAIRPETLGFEAAQVAPRRRDGPENSTPRSEPGKARSPTHPTAPAVLRYQHGIPRWEDRGAGAILARAGSGSGRQTAGIGCPDTTHRSGDRYFSITPA